MKPHHPRFSDLDTQSANAIGIELHTLDVFLRVVESGGMTSAARHLSITQSAVSQKIAALESSLGVTLLDRTVRPIAPTAAGLILAERAQSLLSAARETVQTVRTGVRRAIPNLRLALIDSAAATMGPHLVRRVRNLAGRWSIRSGLAKLHGDALLNREVDVIITADPLEGHGGLVRHEILEEAHVVLTPTSYTGPLEPLALLSRRLDLVRFSARSVSGQGVEAHIRRLRIDAPGHLEFDTADAMIAMVSGGAGWALCSPLCLLQGAAHLEGVRVSPMPFPALSRRISVVAREGELADIPSRIAAASIEALNEVCLPRLGRIAPWLPSSIKVGAQADGTPALSP